MVCSPSLPSKLTPCYASKFDRQLAIASGCGGKAPFLTKRQRNSAKLGGFATEVCPEATP